MTTVYRDPEADKYAAAEERTARIREAEETKRLMLKEREVTRRELAKTRAGWWEENGLGAFLVIGGLLLGVTIVGGIFVSNWSESRYKPPAPTGAECRDATVNIDSAHTQCPYPGQKGAVERNVGFGSDRLVCTCPRTTLDGGAP